MTGDVVTTVVTVPVSPAMRRLLEALPPIDPAAQAVAERLIFGTECHGNSVPPAPRPFRLDCRS